MPDLRSTIDLIKKRKQAIDEAAALSAAPTVKAAPSMPVGRSAPQQKNDETDLLSPAAIEAEYQKQQATKKKNSSWWKWNW